MDWNQIFGGAFLVGGALLIWAHWWYYWGGRAARKEVDHLEGVVDAQRDELSKTARHSLELEERIKQLEAEAKQATIDLAVQRLEAEAHREATRALMNENRALWENMKPSQVSMNIMNRNPMFVEPKEA